MRKLRPRRPSAAMVIACVALVAAFNGPAIASTASTAAAKVKATFNGARIKKNSIPANRIKKNSLTGTQIKESGLGTVPNATHATNATTATNATNATNAATAALATKATTADSATTLSGLKKWHARATSSADNATLATAIAQATSVPLATIGPFTVEGRCFTSAGTLYSIILVATTEARSIFAGQTTLPGGAAASYLNPDSLELTRYVTLTTAAANAAGASPGYFSKFTAISPSGTHVIGYGNVYAKQGTLGAGDGPYGAGNVCLFEGEVQQIA
jgi:hypothetical protein